MADKIAITRDKIAILYEGLTERLLVSISDVDIHKTPVYQRLIGAGICTDKSRLLRGESTQNLAIHQIIEAIERDGMSKKPVPPTAS